MKLACAFVCLLAVVVWQDSLKVQEPVASEESVAVVHFRKVVANHSGFVGRREALKQDVALADAELKDRYAELARAEATALVAQGDDKKDAEEKHKRLKQEVEEFRRTQQKKFLDVEQKIYKDVILDVHKAIDKLAKARGYTLVLLVDPEKPGLRDLEKATATELIQVPRIAYLGKLDRVDITDEIIAELPPPNN
jgi:Skp family chaperone for outer membrane proteins